MKYKEKSNAEFFHLLLSPVRLLARQEGGETALSGGVVVE